MKRPSVATSHDVALRLARGSAGVLVGHSDEGVELGIRLFDAREERVDELDGRNLPPTDELGELVAGLVNEIGRGHHFILARNVGAGSTRSSMTSSRTI